MNPLLAKFKSLKFPGWPGVVVFALLLTFLGAIVCNKVQLPNGDDMARHIMNGQEILHGNFDVLYKNVYSYTMPDAQFVNHHWLSGVIFYLIFQVAGWGGLGVFKIFTWLSIFTLLFVTALKRSNFWLASFLSLPVIFILAERGSLRPEIFSYLFIATFLYFLIDSEDHPDSKKIFWLVPMQLLWVNLHIFFIIGPAMVAGFLLEKIILNFKDFKDNPLVKKLSLLLLSLVAVCFLNPNGWKGVFLPFSIFQNIGVAISENQSILYFLRTNPHWDNLSVVFFGISVLILAAAFVSSIKRGSKPIFYILASTAIVVAGFFIMRFFVFFAFIFFLAATRELNSFYTWLMDSLKKTPVLAARLAKTLLVSFVVILCLLIYFKSTGVLFSYFKPGLGLTNRALDAALFFKQNGLQGPIFNGFDIGSYLIYNLYPEEKVFMDNRPEAYSVSFFEEVAQAVAIEDAWQEMQGKYQFNVIFNYRYDYADNATKFLYNRLDDPDWALVYADLYAIIFVRNAPENQQVINNFKITPDNVAARMDYLVKSPDYDDQVAAADNFNFLGRTDLGMQTFWTIVEKWPKSGKIWKVMADWQLADNSTQSTFLAIMYLERALDTGYRTADTYTMLAAAYTRLGHIEPAREAINKALKINSDYKDALGVLEIINSRSI